MDLLSISRVIWRHKLLVFPVFVLTFAAAFYFLAFSKPLYETTATTCLPRHRQLRQRRKLPLTRPWGRSIRTQCVHTVLRPIHYRGRRCPHGEQRYSKCSLEAGGGPA